MQITFKNTNDDIYIFDLTLTFPSTVVTCSYNTLKKITCNEELKVLNCHYNHLKQLKLNDELEDLSCKNNYLTSLKCNKGLKHLDCSYNRLTELELNDGLEFLECSENDYLTTIKYFPPTLTAISCDTDRLDFETQLRISKHCSEYNCSLNYGVYNKLDYKRYLVLLLGFKDSYVLKYLVYHAPKEVKKQPVVHFDMEEDEEDWFEGQGELIEN
jgi:Leucine-rich repeat (LRR) protein